MSITPPSHLADFTFRDILRLFAPTGIVVAALAASLHLGSRAGWLPHPRPALDMDRAVLVHQADSSGNAHPAHLVLIGDSSCLMNVAAPELAELLGQPVLNLATLSYIDLPVHARLLRRYAAANPGRLRTVVLLMHPESLRLSDLPGYHRNQLQHYLDGREGQSTTGIAATLEAVLAVDRLRNRCLSRFLAWPLPGDFGRFYGFARDLERFMTGAQGSAVDPRTFNPDTARGTAEYRLAARIEEESRRFRRALPEGARLVVGLTPTPASFALPDHATRQAAMLVEWAAWLEADAILTDLPATLPDDAFASIAHLDGRSRIGFTERLAGALGRVTATGR